MRGGSLFSGIGGFEIAAVLAGLDVDWRWQVECDADCRRVLEHHFPETDRSVTDVREANATNLEPVDIIVGGFPCQDISVAGSGAGLAGERSGLWGEYARIVRELRPRCVVVENSSALLARGFDVAAADLVACGYDLEWDCIPASAIGAPHQRDRLWIVAHANRDALRLLAEREQRRPTERGDAEPVGTGSEGRTADTDADRGGREALGRAHGGGGEDRTHTPGPDADGRVRAAPDATIARLEGWREGLRADSARGYWRSVAPPEPTLRRVDDGLPGGVDGSRQRRRREQRDPEVIARKRARRALRDRDAARLKQLGNAVVPQVAAIALARVRDLA